MKRLVRWLALPLVCLCILACGTLEVGIEPRVTPTAEKQLALATSTPLIATQVPTDTLVPPTATATATAVLTPTPFPMTTPERITFAPGGTSYTLNFNLNRWVAKAYILTIQAQQQMTITENSMAVITVLDSHDKVVAPTTSRQGLWAGIVPQTGDYKIAFLGEGLVNVDITIPPPATPTAQ